MRLHEDILRYMTVKVEELEAGPSAMMRREEREERFRSPFALIVAPAVDCGDRPMRAPRAPREDFLKTNFRDKGDYP